LSLDKFAFEACVAHLQHHIDPRKEG